MKQLSTGLLCSNISPNNCGEGFEFGVVWVVWVGFFSSFLKLEIVIMIVSFDFLIQILEASLPPFCSICSICPSLTVVFGKYL